MSDATASASTSNQPSTSASGSSIKVFLPPTAASSSSSSSTTLYPPISEEEDLKPTPEELRLAFRSTLSGRLTGPDAPLLTRAMREKEEARLGLHSSRNRTWENVKIRIRFSDRTMVEGVFTESDRIDKVYEFLDSTLNEEASKVGRVLYSSPPRVEYKRGEKKTLRELGLIPSAVVSVRWDEARMNTNSFPAPLKKELREKAQALPPPPSFDHQQQQGGQGAGNGASGKEAKPMPKWLKNIVKK